MVQFSRSEHVYPYPTPTPLLAFFLRYPNPFARHVISTDILSRSIDVLGRLHTTRLILKRGIIPAWASRWLPGLPTKGGLDAWIVEESVVDPPNWSDEEVGRYPRLRCEQGNLNHRKFMHVIEGGEIRADPNGTTVHLTTAEVRSDLGGSWSNTIRQRIESYGASKFEVNAETARKGMSLVISLIRNHQPLPDTADFYPPPPPGFGENWPEPRP